MVTFSCPGALPKLVEIVKRIGRCLVAVFSGFLVVQAPCKLADVTALGGTVVESHPMLLADSDLVLRKDYLTPQDQGRFLLELHSEPSKRHAVVTEEWMRLLALLHPGWVNVDVTFSERTVEEWAHFQLPFSRFGPSEEVFRTLPLGATVSIKVRAIEPQTHGGHRQGDIANFFSSL